MSYLGNIFNLILYQPLFNALVLLYTFLPGHDFGIAVILLTIFIRLLIYPLTLGAIKSQKAISELQPKIQEIQKEYKADQEKQAKELMLLYQKEKINPLSSLFFLFIQLPILIALFKVFGGGFKSEAMIHLYDFVPNPVSINASFLGIINLGQPNFILTFLAGIFQFFQTKMMPQPKLDASKQDEISRISERVQQQFLYILPIFTILILWRLPSVISLYWIVTTLFSIGQQYLVFRKEIPSS